MKEITLPVSGNLRAQHIKRVKNTYCRLCSKIWKGKTIWESIRDNDLTAAPSFVGDSYHQQAIKIMIVGRAVNGWQVDFADCSSLESTVDSIIRQENRLDDFAKECIWDELNKKNYYYAKSPFLRMMRQLVGALTGSEESWQQKIVWSNLYKIAPRDGGNPSWLMIRDNLSDYIALIREEILQNRPDIVVFATDMDFFDPYQGNDKYASFYELMDCRNNNTELPEYICAAGTFTNDSNTVMIVCKRPERRPIANLVKNICDTYAKLSNNEI